MGRKNKRPYTRVERVMAGTVVTLVAIALAWTGVIAAAWYTQTNPQASATGTGGTVSLAWQAPMVLANSSYYTGCGVDMVTSNATSITFYGTDFGPGDYCIYAAELVNTGTLPLNISTATTYVNAGGSYLLTTLENPTAYTIGPAHNGVTYSFPVVAANSVVLAPDHPSGIVVHFAFGLWSWASQSQYSGQPFSATLTVTGTADGGDGP